MKPCHPPAPPQLPVPAWLLRRQRVPRLASPVPRQRRHAPPPPWAAGKSLCPGNPKQSWVCPAATALPQAGGGSQRGSTRVPTENQSSGCSDWVKRQKMLLRPAGYPCSCPAWAAPAHGIAPHPRQGHRACPKGVRVGKEGTGAHLHSAALPQRTRLWRMRQVETGYPSLQLTVHPPQMWWHFVT